MTLKAYAVLENFENTGGIFFATRDIIARKAGANEYADGDISSVSCRRAPWADEYATTGKVPIRLQVEHGWNYECCGCGVRIDEDLYDRIEDDAQEQRYEGWTPAEIVEDGNYVFCLASCRDAYKANRAAIEAEQLRHRQRLEKFLTRRFPDIALIDNDRYRSRPHVYCQRDREGNIRLEQIIIPFDYPGAKHGPGDLHFHRSSYRHNHRRLSYSCAGGDIEAFTTWLKNHDVRQRTKGLSS